MTILRKLWNDEVGFVVSTELMLVATILVIGVIVGLQSLRVAVVAELADTGSAIGAVSQTYVYTGIQGHHASTNGSRWSDDSDTCELADASAGGDPGTAVQSLCVQTCTNLPANETEVALTFSN